MLEPFELVVSQHGPAVLRLCRALLGPHEAEDAWSETFLAALKAYPALDPGANVQAWLVTIAKRKAIDQHRAAARNPTPTEALPERPSTVGLPGDSDADLWTALQSLTLLQREAIAFHYLAGLPYAEVATCLGNSEAAARRAATDGMKKLRATYRKATRHE